ncbi:MAG: hypothetical protein AAF088_12970 [Pseudomonadota bacterium]
MAKFLLDKCENSTIAVVDVYWTEYPYPIFKEIRNHLNPPLARGSDFTTCMKSDDPETCFIVSVGPTGREDVPRNLEEVRLLFEPPGEAVLAYHCKWLDIEAEVELTGCGSFAPREVVSERQGCIFSHNACWRMSPGMVARYRALHGLTDESVRAVAVRMLEEAGYEALPEQDANALESIATKIEQEQLAKAKQNTRNQQCLLTRAEDNDPYCMFFDPVFDRSRSIYCESLVWGSCR